jgi:iron(III) transport system ATP-binding protein
MTSLTVTDLHKGFASQPVLRGIDLDVADGSLTAILGPSGSGKTTLLRVLAGFDGADRGTVRLGDLVVDDARHRTPPERRHIGYVPQEGALFPHLRVADNVAFGLNRRQRRSANVRDLLDMVGLTGFERRYPHQLSGGQQQRVALARALAIRPALVLLDEPFASLDVGLRASLRTDVARVLRDAGTTALLVTHDQDEALSLADRVAVVRGGRIAQCAAPRELYERPADAELASFLGAANLVDGVVAAHAVQTPLGELALRSDCLGPPQPSPGVVLVRPEQVEIGSAGHPGLAGRVTGCEYHGHDAIVTVEATEPAGRSPILVRVAGGGHWADQEAVTLVAHGPVVAWTRREADGPVAPEPGRPVEQPAT